MVGIHAHQLVKTRSPEFLAHDLARLGHVWASGPHTSRGFLAPALLGLKVTAGVKTSPQTLIFAPGWHALGYSTTNVERLSGQHAGELLAVINEGSGVEDEIYDAVDSWDYSRLLVTGNPLRPDGRFVELIRQAEHDRRDGVPPREAVNAIRIPSTDSPHAHLERSPYGLASRTWLEAQTRQYGPDSQWVRSHIKAEVPTVAEDSLHPRVKLARRPCGGGVCAIPLRRAPGVSMSRRIACDLGEAWAATRAALLGAGRLGHRRRGLRQHPWDCLEAAEPHLPQGVGARRGRPEPDHVRPRGRSAATSRPPPPAAASMGSPRLRRAPASPGRVRLHERHSRSEAAWAAGAAAGSTPAGSPGGPGAGKFPVFVLHPQGRGRTRPRLRRRRLADAHLRDQGRSQDAGSCPREQITLDPVGTFPRIPVDAAGPEFRLRLTPMAVPIDRIVERVEAGLSTEARSRMSPRRGGALVLQLRRASKLI